MSARGRVVTSITLEPELGIVRGRSAAAQLRDLEQPGLHRPTYGGSESATLVGEIQQTLVRNAQVPVRTDAVQQGEVLLGLIESSLHTIPPLFNTIDDNTALPQFNANGHRQLIGLVPGNIVRTEPSGLRITV